MIGVFLRDALKIILSVLRIDSSGVNGYQAMEAVSYITYFILKCLLSGIIIGIVSEVAKRSPALGALIVSLPLVSLLAIIWLWRDTKDVERIANHAQSTFWYVLPSLPMFLALPAMLRAGVSFWTSIGASCALTIVLYSVAAAVMARFGISF